MYIYIYIYIYCVLYKGEAIKWRGAETKLKRNSLLLIML